MLKSLFKEVGGNVAIISALTLPLVLGFVGGGVDFYRWNNERVALKELADTLATRGAREFLLANATETQIRAVVDNVLESGFAESYGFSALAHDVAVDMDDAEVTVNLVTHPAEGLFLTNFMPFMADHNITSTAVALGGMNVCVVALEDHDAGAVSAAVNSSLLAEECSIMSNSVSTQGVVSSGLSEISAGLICSGGGSYGGAQNFSPQPTLDCPTYNDPLVERAPPTVGACTEFDAAYGDRIDEVATAALGSVTDTVDNLTGGLTGNLAGGLLDTVGLGADHYTLNPGVYCGGLTIGALADVTFNPGIYVIKDGPLAVGLGGKLLGENVGFYLVGDESTFYFGPEAVIDLTAPKDGPMAGILFFEDRNAPTNRVHRILSDDARTLLGTFYLSRGVLQVASLLPVADQSAYTAIVARKLDMDGSPTLVLNADYNATDIPVPQGVGPVGSTVYLRE
ncbi:TadE/TadG family type IV pilus assembly protein [Hyphococcus sp.]|uniref:TadE/TadG family type IV pilus assembly protein n=1 Tax=Hyphococcus sp. TaxID=2038636 RepID=UPI00374FF09C